MDPQVYFADNRDIAGTSEARDSERRRQRKAAGKNLGAAMLAKWWAIIRDDEGQGVSEYAVLLVLLVLIVVATVHAIGINAQQVIDRVNTALHG